MAGAVDVVVVAHDSGANDLPGLSDWNRRWVGEEGYQGMVAKQLQAFKQATLLLKWMVKNIRYNKRLSF